MSRPATLLDRASLGACVFALAACGSSGASDANGSGACSSVSTFPTSPLAAIPSDGRKLHVEFRTAPYQPLVAGLQCVEIVVSDPTTGVRLDGLAIAMTPWMTAMDHGASVTPAVTALGHGRYVFTNVSLVMPGEWQLKTQFSGKVVDSVEPTFSVE